MLLNVASAEICGSTVKKGGVAGAEFSADVTFSQWFCSLINVCSSLRSLLFLCERNAVLQGKIAFESCSPRAPNVLGPPLHTHTDTHTHTHTHTLTHSHTRTITERADLNLR